VYFQRDRTSGIWRVPVDGGEETEVVPGPTGAHWAAFTGGLYYFTWTEKARWGELVIWHLDIESGQKTDLFRREGPVISELLAVSPDEQWILFGEEPLPTSELMLVENFR
jgi:hypothetical protein